MKRLVVKFRKAKFYLWKKIRPWLPKWFVEYMDNRAELGIITACVTAQEIDKMRAYGVQEKAAHDEQVASDGQAYFPKWHHWHHED